MNLAERIDQRGLPPLAASGLHDDIAAPTGSIGPMALPASAAASRPCPLLVLGKHVLERIACDHATVLAAVEQAFVALGSGVSDNPRKLMCGSPEAGSVAYAMLGLDGARATLGFKTSYKHDPAHEREQQKYYTTLLLFDDATGLPVALMDASGIGALRTPAVSALIAREAAPHARVALIVGTGTQGRMAAPFLLSALPGIERIIVHGRHAQGIEEVRQHLARFDPARDIEVSTDLAAAARQADIVLGVAGAGAPHAVPHAALKRGALAILVGYGIHADALHRADYRIATSEAQMRVTGADLADAAGELPGVDAQLPDILLGRKPARLSDDQTVFAYNSGMVVTDIALGRALADAARARGLGEEIALW